MQTIMKQKSMMTIIHMITGVVAGIFAILGAVSQQWEYATFMMVLAFINRFEVWVDLRS